MSFTHKAPVWNAEGVEPSEDLKNQGFTAGYKPPADYFNYMFNNYQKCIDELQTTSETTESVVKSSYIELRGELETTNNAVNSNSADITTIKKDYVAKEEFNTHTHNQLEHAFSGYNVALTGEDDTLIRLDPLTDGVIDVGKDDSRFRDGYFSGTVNAEVLKQAGVALDNIYGKKTTLEETSAKAQTALDTANAVGDNLVETQTTVQSHSSSIVTLYQNKANVDGTNASGTWGIDISGTAAKATNDSSGNKIVDTYLKKSGGSLDINCSLSFTRTVDTRKVTIDASGVKHFTHSGSWANGDTYYKADGETILCSIGALGNNDELQYLYVGGTYDEPILKIHPEKALSIGRKDYTNVGTKSIAVGNVVTASGGCSQAFGKGTLASGDYSQAAGDSTTASGRYSVSEGQYTTASGNCSHASGYNTTALAHQFSLGHFNNTYNAAANSEYGTSSGTAFVIGNGSSSTAPSNAFRVTGNGETIAKMAYSTTGADYAEFAEWEDGNPDNEDRRGYFVTRQGIYIRKANAGEWIDGVISAMPSVVGNYDEEWYKRYVLDDFGAFIEETFEYQTEEVIGVDEETGEPIIETKTKTGTRWKENPEYDKNKEYIPRENRQEWDKVGMVGVVAVRDDGTCQVNGFCKCADGGIATSAEPSEHSYLTPIYRVLDRVTDNIVKIRIS